MRGGAGGGGGAAARGRGPVGGVYGLRRRQVSFAAPGARGLAAVRIPRSTRRCPYFITPRKLLHNSIFGGGCGY